MPISNIITPVFTHQWRIAVELAPTFSVQAVSLDYNLIKKEIKLVVEHDIRGLIQDEIHDLMLSSGRRITVDLMDCSGNVLKTLIFSDCILTNHLFGLNYAVSAAAKHELEFRFDKITMVDPNTQTSSSVTNSYTRAMGIVGRP